MLLATIAYLATVGSEAIKTLLIATFSIAIDFFLLSELEQRPDFFLQILGHFKTARRVGPGASRAKPAGF